MRKFRHFFPFLPLVLGVSESFVLVPSPSPKRSTSAANLHRHLASSPLSSATGSDSNYISFSADTGFLVSPSAFNVLLDRFELRKRIGILLNHDLESKIIPCMYGKGSLFILNDQSQTEYSCAILMLWARRRFDLNHAIFPFQLQFRSHSY